MRPKRARKKLGTSPSVGCLRDCRWRLKKSSLRVHLKLEIERVDGRVRTDAVVLKHIFEFQGVCATVTGLWYRWWWPVNW